MTTFGSTDKCCRQTAVFLIAITESLLHDEVRTKHISKEAAHDVILTIKEEAQKMGWLLGIVVIGLMVPNLAFASYQGANITDSTYRYAAIENEDFSWSIYRTLNGSTEQVNKTDYGFDNTTELVDVLNNQETQEELIQTLHQNNALLHQLTTVLQSFIQTLQSAAKAGFTLFPSLAYASVEITGNADTCMGGPPGIDGCPPSKTNATTVNNTTNATTTTPETEVTMDSLGKCLVIDDPDLKNDCYDKILEDKYSSTGTTPPSSSTNGIEITPLGAVINFTAIFQNGTRVTSMNQNITEPQTNMLVQILSGLIAGKDLGELQNLEDLQDYEEEQQQQQEEEQDDQGGDGGGSGGGGGYDPNAPIELMPPEGPGINPWPPTEQQPEPEQPEEPSDGDGDGGGSNDEGSESEG